MEGIQVDNKFDSLNELFDGNQRKLIEQLCAGGKMCGALVVAIGATMAT